MSITTRPYGKEQHGYPVTEYTLTNQSGASVSILDFGRASLPGYRCRIAAGSSATCASALTMRWPTPPTAASMGALIGRVGNRIGGSQFTLNGQTYPLTPNNGPNNLHGGPEGFNLRMWQVAPVQGRRRGLRCT